MSNQDSEILRLTSDDLVQIFKYLEYTDLLRCGFVCRKFYEVAIRDQLWKRHCIKHWDVYSLESEQSSWRSSFIDRHREDGRYINCFLKIRKAWQQIETYCEKFCPGIYRSLQAGLSDKQIDDLESQYKLRLPDDVRCVYKFHNGQRWDAVAGLLGSVRVYHLHSSEMLLPLDYALQSLKELFGSDADTSMLPLTYCRRTKQLQLVALDGSSGLNVGQVFYPTADYQYRDAYLSSDSFLTWFCTYADQLASDSFPCIKNEILKFYHEPECTAKTGSITVTAATAFVPSQSTIRPPKFFHAYRITMSMDASARESETCQLRTRHWIITDENGHEERVDGDGVIGEYPIMKPGAQYSYVSCCPMTTTYGSMGGHFSFVNSSTGCYPIMGPGTSFAWASCTWQYTATGTMGGHFSMVNTATGQAIDVACPLFHLRAPPYVSGLDRKKRQ